VNWKATNLNVVAPQEKCLLASQKSEQRTIEAKEQKFLPPQPILYQPAVIQKNLISTHYGSITADITSRSSYCLSSSLLLFHPSNQCIFYINIIL
jgi:hypothetical protein